MKIGDILEVRRNGQTGVGLVIKVYRDHNDAPVKAFIRLIYDDFKKESKSSWGRYGVSKGDGLFVNLLNPETRYRILDASCVDIKKSYINTIKEVATIGRDEAWAEPTVTKTSRKAFTIKYNDGVKKLTYVYLVDKNVGGWSEDDEKIAGLRAMRNYINILELYATT